MKNKQTYQEVTEEIKNELSRLLEAGEIYTSYELQETFYKLQKGKP